MQSTDLEKFVKIINVVGEVYGKEVSEMLLKVYWKALKRFPLADVQRAFNRHVQNPTNGQFWPKPADLIRLLDGDPESRAMIAWRKVLDAIEGVGSYQTVVFDDPVIHMALENLGGWLEVCKVTDDELPFLAKRFEVAYRGFAARPALKYPKQFIGSIEHQNRLHGFEDDIPKPRAIGDQALAQEVYRGGVTGASTQIGEIETTVGGIVRMIQVDCIKSPRAKIAG